ncbi:MAG: hypothetical protein JWL59_4861 [Chthoniobacteraceae bacterium]|nr:hypothetical protein [Chthoniobacteraceae bacterium]
MIKGKPQPENNGSDVRQNPEINAKIDAYIQANPKRWEYIQGLTPERMARTIVLQDIQKQERTERMRNSVLKKIEEDPEVKQAYQTLVKNLPEDQRQKVIATLALSAQRAQQRGQAQSQPAQQV